MSMSTYAIGLRPATDEYKAKLAAYEACEKAGVTIPLELTDYFDDEEPNPDGMEVNIEAASEKFKDDMQEGIDVHINLLPEGVQTVRFINSW